MKPRFTIQHKLHQGMFVTLMFIAGMLISTGSYGQCTNSSPYMTAAAPTTTTPYTISSCTFQSEYNTITGVTAGYSYTSTYSLGGCITVHSGSYNGPIVAWGATPLTWTATVSGTYYIHYNTNCACGTATSCGTTTITCNSCTGGANPCTSITNIPTCGSSVTVNISGTGAWSPGSCGFSTPGNEAIFSFTPTTSGTYSLNVTNNTGGFIDYFWVNSTAGCSATAGWNCIDDIFTTGTYGAMNWVAGQTYYILLDPEGTGAYSASFSINCITAGSGPCATATNIIGCGASYAANLSGTGAWNPLSCGFSTPGVEIVYSYTATSTGNYTINFTAFTGSFVDVSYQGTTCSSTGWTCIDDVISTGNTPSFFLTAGVTYYFLFDPETTTGNTFTFNLECPGSVVTASDCSSAVNICDNANFQIDPNGYGAVMEIPPLGSVGNPDNLNPGGSGNWGCLRSATPELNSTWMIVNIAVGGNLEFSFGAGGAQAGFYDWIMYPYDPATTCSAIPTGNYAPVRCNWNGSSTGGTGCSSAANLPAGGSMTNYEAPLPVLTGEQYIICFSNYSSAVTSVPLDFFGTAVVSCLPLPSELINFNGTLDSKQVLLSWSTASEINTSHFIVEHSLNGIDFEAVGMVDASGTSNQVLNYDFVHNAPMNGTNYYRLQSVDINHDQAASRIIAINYFSGFEIEQIYPNPSDDNFTINISSFDELPVEIEITDVTGKRVYFQKTILSAGTNNVMINSSELADGLYNLHVTNPNDHKSIIQKIIKQH